MMSLLNNSITGHLTTLVERISGVDGVIIRNFFQGDNSVTGTFVLVSKLVKGNFLPFHHLYSSISKNPLTTVSCCLLAYGFYKSFNFLVQSHQRRTNLRFLESFDEMVRPLRARKRDIDLTHIHNCDSAACGYASELYSLKRSSQSDHGFCELARTRLTTFSGIFLDGNKILISRPGNPSDTGFPSHVPGISKRRIPYLATYDWVGTSYLLDLNNPFINQTLETLGFIYISPIELDFLIGAVATKFEATPAAWSYKDSSRGVNVKGTRAKSSVEMRLVTLSAYYRHLLGEVNPDFGAGIYLGPSCYILYREEDSDDEILEIEVTGPLDLVACCSRESPKTPDVLAGSLDSLDQKPLAKNEDPPNEILVFRDPVKYDTYTVLPKQGLLVEAFKGVETEDDTVQLLEMPFNPEVVEIIKEHPDQKPGKERSVLYSVVYGITGGVYNSSPEIEKLTIGTRIRKTKEGAFKYALGDEDVTAESLCSRIQFETIGDGEFHSFTRTLDLIWDSIPEKMKDLKPHQRRRIVDVLNKIEETGEFKWTEKEVKFFPKSDELLMKPKPRIITFVPTIAWVRMVLILDAFLGVLKRGKHNRNRFTYKNKHLDIYWASGMTQEQLSEAMTVADTNKRLHGIDFVFICGDDNIGSLISGDASKYDASQKEKFFELQNALFSMFFRAEDRSKVLKTCQELFSYHKGKRIAKFFDYKVRGVSLPTGGPHTLVFNTLGMMAFYLTFFINLVDLDINEEDYDVYLQLYLDTADTLGLEMTTTRNLNLNGRYLAGSEFLKGVIAIHGENLRWIPCPGGLCKVGKVLVEEGEKFNGSSLATRTREIAAGMKSFYLDPLRHAHYSVWGKETNPVQENAWVNIHGGEVTDEMRAKFLRETEDFWKELFEKRYGLDWDTVQSMAKQILKNGQTFAAFGGPNWESIVQVDYLGISPSLE